MTIRRFTTAVALLASSFLVLRSHADDQELLQKPTTKQAPPAAPDNLDFEEAAKRIIVPIQQNEPWKSVSQDYAACRKEVLEDLYHKIGLTLPPGKRVEVRFIQDRTNGVMGFTVWQPWGATMDIKSNNPSGMKSLLNRALFQHEMVHALQDANMARNIESVFPTWVTEGYAMWAAGHGPRKTLPVVAKSSYKSFDGLNQWHQGSAIDYAETYLSFLYLEDQIGPDGIRDLIKMSTTGRVQWKEALERCSKMKWADFERNAKYYCQDFALQISPQKASTTGGRAAPPPPPPAQVEPEEGHGQPAGPATQSASGGDNSDEKAQLTEEEKKANTDLMAKYRQPMEAAITAGDAAKIKALIQENPKVVAMSDERGATPLHWAANNAKRAVVDALIAGKADVNAQTKSGATPLHYALSRDCIEALVAAGAKIEAKGPLGMTPLHLAAWAGNVEKVKTLIALKANLNARDKHGQTPLHGSVWSLNSEVTSQLINGGADVNAKDNDEHTPLWHATRWHIVPTMIAALKKAGGGE